MLDPQGASYYIRVAKQMLTGSQAKFCHTKRVPQKNRKQKHEEEVAGCEPHIILDSFFFLLMVVSGFCIWIGFGGFFWMVVGMK